MKKFCGLFSVMVLLIAACAATIGCGGGGGGNPTGPFVPPAETVLTEQLLNVANATETVTLEEGISVTIPKGLTNSDFTLKITTAANVPAPPVEFRAVKAFDVNLSFADHFSTPLIIRISFDPADIQVDKIKDNFTPAYYDETGKSWVLFSEYELNTDQNYIEFKTSHLTPLAFFELVTLGAVYDAKFVGQKGLTVYYSHKDEHKFMADTAYEQSSQPWHISASDKNWAPIYVQDTAYYIAQARKAFQTAPQDIDPSNDSNINIYIRNLSGIDGQYNKVAGAIYIANSPPPNHSVQLSFPELLRATCAHEYLHLVQHNYYYMNANIFGTSRWWLEALATQADRMVWGSALNFSESETFAISDRNPSLYNVLSRSWDDCNEDPNFYLAGCFFQYMSTYRTGAKLNIADLVKAGANSGNYVDILDAEISRQLGSSIGAEFSDYIEYLFFAGNSKLTALSHKLDINDIEGNFDHRLGEKVTIKNSTLDKTKVAISMPHLSAKVVTVHNEDKSSDGDNGLRMLSYKLAKTNYNSGHNLCKISQTGNKLELIKQIYSGDTGQTAIQSGERLVILLANPYKSGTNKTVEFEFALADAISVQIVDGNIEKKVATNDTTFTQTFTASAGVSGDYLFKWKFGDGNTENQSVTSATQSQVNHTYSNFAINDSFDVVVELYTADGSTMLNSHSITISVKEQPALASISLTPETIFVKSGYSADLSSVITVTATYSDSSTSNISSDVIWSIKNGPGTIAGKNYSNSEDYSAATLVATYNDGGITKTAELAVGTIDSTEPLTGVDANPGTEAFVKGATWHFTSWTGGIGANMSDFYPANSLDTTRKGIIAVRKDKFFWYPENQVQTFAYNTRYESDIMTNIAVRISGTIITEGKSKDFFDSKSASEPTKELDVIITRPTADPAPAATNHRWTVKRVYNSQTQSYGNNAEINLTTDYKGLTQTLKTMISW